MCWHLEHLQLSQGSLLRLHPCVSVPGSICECWCGRWDGMSLCTLEVRLGTSRYTCWTKNIVEQGQLGANTCQELLLLISWYLFGFYWHLEIFYSVLKLQFGMNIEVRNTNGSWNWELFGCQDLVLPGSALAKSCCTCARGCSLFTGCARQCCGNCTVKESSKAIVVFKGFLEKFVSSSLPGALEVALAVGSQEQIRPEFVSRLCLLNWA